MPASVKARDRDYAKLKKYSEEHGISITGALAKAVSTMGVKKLESKEKDVFTCEECENKVPGYALFCPYCGAEFEEEDESDDDEEEEDESEE
jgi:hypothetical protein